MTSLSLLARRTALTMSRRSRCLINVSRTFSAQSKDYFNATTDDTQMHDQFAILESMLEDGMKIADEKRAMVKRMRPMAVDAPDGETDGHIAEELREITLILEDHVAQKDKIKKRMEKLHAAMEEAQKTFAVDSPDGETDGHTLEELQEINHIIEDAAKLEDTEKIEYQHKMEEGVKKDRARDPEHDW